MGALGAELLQMQPLWGRVTAGRSNALCPSLLLRGLGAVGPAWNALPLAMSSRTSACILSQTQCSREVGEGIGRTGRGAHRALCRGTGQPGSRRPGALQEARCGHAEMLLALGARCP